LINPFSISILSASKPKSSTLGLIPTDNKSLSAVNLLFLSPFFISESLKVSYFNNSIELGDSYLLFVTLWLIASIINMYLLYTFKKLGKQMYLYIFIASIILALFGGPIASDPVFYIIDGLGMAVNGALLVMLYYTPISKKF